MLTTVDNFDHWHPLILSEFKNFSTFQELLFGCSLLFPTTCALLFPKWHNLTQFMPLFLIWLYFGFTAPAWLVQSQFFYWVQMAQRWISRSERFAVMCAAQPLSCVTPHSSYPVSDTSRCPLSYPNIGTKSHKINFLKKSTILWCISSKHLVLLTLCCLEVLFEVSQPKISRINFSVIHDNFVAVGQCSGSVRESW